MSNSPRAQLDARILDVIRSARHPIYDGQCLAIARMAGPGAKDDWRVVDRRIQALRKAGKIRYVNRKWEVVGE